MAEGGWRAARRYYSGRVAPAFYAHLFKAVTRRYHHEVIPVFRALLREDAIVFDVGANTGQFTKLFSRIVPRGFVFAVEPQSYARTILGAAVRLNRLRNVAILPMALGAAPGVGLLSLPVKASGSYGSGIANLAAAVGGREFEVEAVAIATLDQIVAALALDRVDLIKADIEGAELELLRGAERTLASLGPALYLDLDPNQLTRSGDTLGALWDFLHARGYRPFDPSPVPERTAVPEPRGGHAVWLPSSAVGR